MEKIFNCTTKDTGYFITQGRNYTIVLNVAKSKTFDHNYHSIVNDKGVSHYIGDDDLKKFFISLEKLRQDKLKELLK
jgi:hypothetical protein